MKQVARVVAGLAAAGSRLLVPLRARRTVVAWIGRHDSVPYRDWLAFELLRDFVRSDPNAGHRFLWTHHLAYAATYRVEDRFGRERINQTRHLLFADLDQYLVQQGIDPEKIHSVFEVGSSLGYLLHHLEDGIFHSATSFEGIDIDRRAVELGSRHLAAVGSKVKLTAADSSELDRVLGGRTIDVILCAGVLLYLPEASAREVVRSILRHTRVVAVFAGLAHPLRDNASLAASAIRRRDHTFIHDLDAMVRDAGGHVAWRRWEGPRMVDGNTIYFVFARPGPAT